MNGKEYENLSEINIVMTREGGNLGEQDNSQEDRGWMNDDVRASIDGRK